MDSTQDRFGNTAETPIPAWFLAPHEDKEIRARCLTQATDQCKDQFMALGKCTEQHQLLFSWKCADLKEQVNKCIAFWGSYDKYEDMRADFIEEKRQQLREDAQKRRQ